MPQEISFFHQCYSKLLWLCKIAVSEVSLKQANHFVAHFKNAKD